ncbi:MAG: hypothetical protein LBI36_06375 [Oscillospiraceae bacterium]|jgi:ABC-type molybdate transport system substrate-binding protein|nr:hypothetical protein [Oscillospiraceae bacterium]
MFKKIQVFAAGSAKKFFEPRYNLTFPKKNGKITLRAAVQAAGGSRFVAILPKGGRVWLF